MASEASNLFVESLKESKNNYWTCDLKDACTQQLLNDLPNFIWRKTLTNSEKDRIDKLKATLPDNNEDALSEFLQYLLVSPQFHIKNAQATSGASTSAISDPYEIASRISFALIQSAPSYEVLNKIFLKEFNNSSQVKSYYKSLVETDEFQKVFVKNIIGNWFGFA